MTVAVGTIALNIICEGLLLMVLLIVMKKYLLLTKLTQFKTIEHTPYPIYGQNRYPIFELND